MRKITGVFLVITLVLLGLFGCGAKDNSLKAPVSGTDSGKTTEENDHSQVCDRWADSGIPEENSDGTGESFSYDYRIPMIKDDTEGAVAINDRLATVYEGMHNRVQKAKEAGSISAGDYERDMDLYNTGYDCY